MRRATQQAAHTGAGANDFYPRSPCGERRSGRLCRKELQRFLSTLSLRRATLLLELYDRNHKFLSTLSLRRATVVLFVHFCDIAISIHALLAESDLKAPCTIIDPEIFLSTLSLRRATACPAAGSLVLFISIHALLAESDAAMGKPTLEIAYFYPRSPCGERPEMVSRSSMLCQFLSTLSLRRATISMMNLRIFI